MTRRVTIALVVSVLIGCSCSSPQSERSGGMGNSEEGDIRPRRVAVPTSITSDCSRSVEGELMSFIRSVPDGSTIVFPGRKCYGQDLTILLEDRVDLTIEGNGSTFQKRVPSDPSRPNNPSWRIAGGRGVVMKDLIIDGSYDPPRRGSPGQGQFVDHGISLWGATQTSVLNVEISNVNGECLTADSDARKNTDYRFTPPSRDITVDGLRCAHTGRQGVAVTAIDGFTFMNSSIEDAQQNGLDVEIDVDGQIARNVRIVNNTFSGVLFSAISIPIGNYPDVGNIVLERNTMLNSPESCYPAIYVGDSRYRLGEITIADNIVLTIGDGVRLVNVDSGRVSGNRITKTDPGGTGCNNPEQNPANPVPVRLSGSSVTVADNIERGFQ